MVIGTPYQRAITRKNGMLLVGLRALLALSVLFSTTAFADLTARLSSPRIDETQTLELIIRTESRDVQGMPDLEPIRSDFEVLTTRTSSQYRVINGNVQAWTEWIIALRPLRTGTLRIPPLTYRNENTTALELQVVPLDPALKKQMDDRVFFETSVVPDDPYVQAQTIYTRRLLYADGTQIYGEMPDTPVIENAVVLVLGNATSSTVTRNNQRYGMIEQRYAIFPERSGTLTIPGAMVSGSVRMKVNNRLRRNGVRVIAEPTKVAVSPIPSNYPKNTPWLPASDVTLLEAWSESPPRFKVGESITQTLIVRSDSATGSIIPPIDYSIPESHFRSYPEQADIADNRRGNEVIGTRSQSWSIIPIEDGPVTLPAVSITWFNTNTSSVETSTLASRSIRVFGSVDSTTPLDEQTTQEEGTVSAPTAADPELTVDVADRQVFSPLLTLLLVVVLGVLGWLLRHRLPTLKAAAQPQVLRLRTSRRELAQLINTATASELRQAITDSATLHQNARKPVNRVVLAKLYAELDQASYARVASQPDREALRSLVAELFSQPQIVRNEQVLPELYSR